MLSIRGLTKLHAPNTGLQPFDLDVPEGDRLVLLGPSGSGKSTLVRLIAGLEQPDAGELVLNGKRLLGVPPHERGVAFVPQRPALYPHLRLREQISLKDDPFGLGPLGERYPHQLSGGEKQRAVLVRALTRQAALFVFDEPFTPLDPVLRAEIRHDLHLLLEHQAATMILVTHDPIDALALGRRVGVLGDGRLQQLGTPRDLADRPGNRFVALALGQLSLIDGRVRGGDSPETVFRSEDGSVEAVVPPAIARCVALQPTPNLTLGIRPDDVAIRPTANDSRPGVRFAGWSALAAEPVGSGWSLILARGRTRVRIGWPSSPPPGLGHPEKWFIPVDRCPWFDHTGRWIR
jgi:ABC-type Fe3+/spermidine/putrescine transport system ATPase subunit